MLSCHRLVLTIILVFTAAGLAAGPLAVSERRQLTTSGEYHPRWSPDGQTIALTNGAWPDIGVALVDVADGAVTQVSLDRSGDLYLSYHPDGAVLTFDGYASGGGLELYNITLATGAIARLTNGGAFGPAWSPDGERLAFGSGRNGGSHIFTVNAVGGDLQQHTATPGTHYYPAWSPDGTRLAYSSDRNGNTDIWIVTVATGDDARFTTDAAMDNRPVWSPDGRWLAWDSFRNGEHHVYARPVDGGDDVCLTAEHTEGGMLDWSADGSAIAYVADGGVWIAEVSGITANQPVSLGGIKALFRR